METRAELKKAAKECLNTNIFSYIGLLITGIVLPYAMTICFATLFIRAILGNLFGLSAHYYAVNFLAIGTFAVLFYLISMFMLYWLVAYSIYVYANDGERVSIFYVLNDHFTLKRYLRFCLKMAVSHILISFWSLLLVIPGIIKAFSYSQVAFLAIDDEKAGVFETIIKSKEMMRGYKMYYFILQLSFILWTLLEPFTLGLITFYLVPYITLTNVAFYFDLNESLEEIEYDL